MALSPEIVSLVVSALAVLVGSTIAFGHHYADKSSKFDEKSQSDELNDIRMDMRADTTILVVIRLWQFLTEVNEKMKKGSGMDIGLLLYDTERRQPFNRLLNDLEKTFKESINIKEAWLAAKFNYGRLSKILYAYAATIGLIGFPLLGLSLPTVCFLSTEQLTIIWAIFAVLGTFFLGPIVYTHRKISSNMTIYQEKWKQYSIDQVKIGK